MDRVRVIDTHLQFCRPLTARSRTEYAVVHHYGPVPAGFDLARIDADHVNDMHMRDRGWCGIGYHAVIKTDGTIEEGRPEWAMGAHDEGENARSLGLLVVSHQKFVCELEQLGGHAAGKIRRRSPAHGNRQELLQGQEVQQRNAAVLRILFIRALESGGLDNRRAL